MPQRWDLHGQAQHSERDLKPPDGLLGAITLVVVHGSNLAPSEEDFEQLKTGIGAVRMDYENLGGLRKPGVDCVKRWLREVEASG